jgi:hypothetical protein
MAAGAFARRQSAAVLPFEPVPRLPDGGDVAGLGRLLLELAAQLGNVRVHGPAHHCRPKLWESLGVEESNLLALKMTYWLSL